MDNESIGVLEYWSFGSITPILRTYSLGRLFAFDPFVGAEPIRHSARPAASAEGLITHIERRSARSGKPARSHGLARAIRAARPWRLPRKIGDLIRVEGRRPVASRQNVRNRLVPLLDTPAAVDDGAQRPAAPLTLPV